MLSSKDQQTSERRANVIKVFGSILKKGWRLLGDDDVIKVITFTADASSKLAKAATFGVQIEKIINDCKGIAPEIDTNWAEYNSKLKEFKEMSNAIDDLVLQGKLELDCDFSYIHILPLLLTIQ